MHEGIQVRQNNVKRFLINIIFLQVLPEPE